MLTPADLRYLLRLVQNDYWEATDTHRSLRIEGKLVEMISGMKGGGTMAAKKKSAAKPSKPAGKIKKK